MLDFYAGEVHGLYRIITSYITLIPGFLSNFGPIGILNLSVLILVFIFLGLVNRYKAKQYLDLLKKQKGNLEAKTFGNFTLTYQSTLDELGIQNFFVKEYNNFRINPEIVKCDYYDFLKGDSKAINSFTGEFMNQYSWAEETAAFLEQKLKTAVHAPGCTSKESATP